MDQMQFQHQIALVTGAAQGIGAAVVRALVEQGAIVAVVDRHVRRLSTYVMELRTQGYHVTAYPADVGDSSVIDDVVGQIERDLGPISILVNVAGVLRTGSIVSLSNEDWAATFAVNATGVFHVSRAVARHMITRQSGVIVTVGSNAADVPRMEMAAYAASKAAATMFTKCLGLELAQHHIRCNIVSPGSTDTEMQRSLWADAAGAHQVITGALESFRVGIPLRKLATPADIADAVVFLVSDRARHITMHDLRVDGGATLGV